MQTTLLRSFCALAATLLAVGCADLPSGPAPLQPGIEASPSRGAASAASATLVAAQRTHALPHDLSVSQVIGPRGGTMQIAQAGITVHFPAGALRKPTSITMTALRGASVAVDFTHVASFGAPVTISFDARGLAPYSGELVGGHFQRREDIGRNGTTTVNEVVRAARGANPSEVSILVRHFSGYILGVGRGQQQEEH